MMPILLALDWDDNMYFEGLLFLLSVAVLMGIYLLVGAIVGAVIMIKYRSVALGVFAGLGTGVILGMASCTASIAAIS